MTWRMRTFKIVAALPVMAALYFVSLDLPFRHGGSGVRHHAHGATQTVTWRDCEPISVVLGDRNLDPAKEALLRESLAVLASASGLSFKIVGTTGEVPQIDWALSGPKMPGSSYPPVYVGWVHRDETNILRDEKVLGSAVANPAVKNSVRQLVTGAVVFNDSLYRSLDASNGPGETQRNLVLHELGHLLGLGHVEHASIMNADPGKWPAGLNAHDLTALGGLPARCPAASSGPVAGR